jgi:hypothetical protein
LIIWFVFLLEAVPILDYFLIGIWIISIDKYRKIVHDLRVKEKGCLKYRKIAHDLRVKEKGCLKYRKIAHDLRVKEKGKKL